MYIDNNNNTNNNHTNDINELIAQEPQPMTCGDITIVRLLLLIIIIILILLIIHTTHMLSIYLMRCSCWFEVKLTWKSYSLVM